MHKNYPKSCMLMTTTITTATKTGITLLRRIITKRYHSFNALRNDQQQQHIHISTLTNQSAYTPRQKFDKNTLKKLHIEDIWYNKAAEYWKKSEATYKAVLGGYPELNLRDIKASKQFLSYFIRNNIIENKRALDCGAGIGRVAKELLSHAFQEVDLVDQNPEYIKEAKSLLKNCTNVKEYYVEGLQSFMPKKLYDCIWIQWVSNHLTDDDYVSFLKRCSKNLTQKGIIIIKENISTQDYVLDKLDYSVTRSDSVYRKLFQEANLDIIKQSWQPDFPDDLFQVNQYALKACSKVV